MPPMFRWILDDTRALLADLRRLWDRGRAKLHWMGVRSKRRIDEAAGGFENIRRGADTRTRMCTACRALIPVRARRCPECGEKPGRSVSTGAGRFAENLMPGWASASALLLTLNLAVYAVSLWCDNRVAPLVPEGRGSWGVTLFLLGSNLPAKVTFTEPWRLLSYGFLHFNLLHLLMNSFSLMNLGPLIEEIYGARRFVVFYLVSVVTGGIASATWREAGASVGASGAICGLVGVAAVWGWKRGGTLGAGIKAQMIQNIILMLIVGFAIPAIDNAAHIGGLLGGAGMAALSSDREPQGAAGRLWDIAVLLAVAAVAGCFWLVVTYYGELRAALISGA